MVRDGYDSAAVGCVTWLHARTQFTALKYSSLPPPLPLPSSLPPSLHMNMLPYSVYQFRLGAAHLLGPVGLPSDVIHRDVINRDISHRTANHRADGGQRQHHPRQQQQQQQQQRQQQPRVPSSNRAAYGSTNPSGGGSGGGGCGAYSINSAFAPAGGGGGEGRGGGEPRRGSSTGKLRGKEEMRWSVAEPENTLYYICRERERERGNR